ncbi:MAG TPA: hypothetical protein VMM36_16185 [Opitutaceae bacterium]|nr:hypothetical protein [Opitutaceae bacterium]
MRISHLLRCSAAASLIAACAAAAEFETPPTLRASDVLEPVLLAGPHFTVDDAVRNGGYLNHFVVHSDYGDFEATGRAMLGIRLKEVAALARISEISKTDVFIRAAKDATVGVVLEPVKAARGITDDPIGTVTRLPRGIGRLFSSYAAQGKQAAESVSTAAGNIGDSHSGSETLNDLSDTSRGAVKSVLSVSSAERRWAKQLGTDPYSTNAVLREAIENIAWFDRIGGLAPGLAGVPSIPGASHLVRAHEIAWEDPRDVRARNKERLLAMEIPAATIERFLEKSALTPSQQLDLLSSLDALDGVPGREALIEQAIDKKSEAEIWFHLDSVRLLTTIHHAGPGISEILTGPKLTLALSTDNRLIAALGVDHLVWTEAVDRIARQYTEYLAARPGCSAEIWLKGTVSLRAREELAAIGWQVLEQATGAPAG